MHGGVVDTLMEIALDCGFDKAAALDVSTLSVRADVREMCSADKCHVFGKNWSCPPACGTLDECARMISSHDAGILVQTVSQLDDPLDWDGMMRAEKRQNAVFAQAAECIRAIFPDALCLGSGPCKICEKCSYPKACRFPDKAISPIEGYGIFVTDTCRKNGLSYHYGEGTIAYTGCFLV